MNILLLGSGGREHAIALALTKSPSLGELYVAPGNPGILEIAKFADVNINNFDGIYSICRAHEIDLVVVGPEQPLADGITDFLIEKNVLVFGPTRKAALLESSKKFAKEFMTANNIPTATFKAFTADEKEIAKEYIKTQNTPIVIKADGLAAGKGVVIANSQEEAMAALDEMFDGIFGSSGNTVVIEEFMDGDEASIFAICDGEDFICLAPAQDHKRIFDGDKGKNTGGMGSYAPAPIVGDSVLRKVEDLIIRPTLQGMKQNGTPFVGVLFVGLMIKNGEPKVVEFNVRFGDPETQSVLAVFEGDFAQLLKSAAEGKIDKSAVLNIAKQKACCVVAASNGYPDEFKKGFAISGIENAINASTSVLQAGTKSVKDGVIITNGGRVLGVVGIADDLESAVRNAYIGISKINFENIYFRNDIAHKAF